MKAAREISDFMERVGRDSRLGPMHVSLYMAILFCWLRQGGSGAARMTGRELMPLSKIGGLTPMYRALKELNAWGYIDYRPSHSAKDKSRVFLPLMEKRGYRWER